MNYRTHLDKLMTKAVASESRLRQDKADLARSEIKVRCALKAQRTIQNLAQSVQQHAHAQISGIVSRCLRSVFGKRAYKFIIVFERKRGRTEARFVFVRRGNKLDPKSGAGGGVLDVASFALRLACLILTRPQQRLVMIMDEPFKNVHSPLYRERVRAMLETLSEEMNVQFIMSTGIEDLHCGKVIEL